LSSLQESSEEKDSEEKDSVKNKDSDTDDFDKTLMKTVAESKKRTAKRRKSRESVSPMPKR
jgi:hypothetical protein